MKKTLLAGLALGVMMLGTAGMAQATLVFNLGGCDFSVDSGGTGSCGGSGADLPYNALTLTFEQLNVDTVRLTMDAGGMPDYTGKISDVWFNVADPFTFSSLNFAYVSGVLAKDIDEGGNVSSAGDFVMNYEYYTTGALGTLYYDRTSVYDITALGLVENDFYAFNAEGYAAIMHVNVTGNGQSGHYVSQTPVPEPATMLLLGTGLAGLVAARRRRKAAMQS